MASTMNCPYCPAVLHFSETATTTTCPKCHNPVNVAQSQGKPRRTKVGAATTSASGAFRSIPAGSTGENAVNLSAEADESSLPAWISPPGLVPFAFAAVGLLQATLLGRHSLRFATIALAVLGIVSIAGCLWATRSHRRRKDEVWFAGGGFVNLLVVLLAVLSPATLNRWWGMDGAVARPDPSSQFLVVYDQMTDPGRPLQKDEVADAATEAVRLGDDLAMRVESIREGLVAGKGKQSYLLVHFRTANLAHTVPLLFNGFANGTLPVLTDDTGRSLAFHGQQLRKRVSGPPVFDELAANAGPIEVKPSLSMDLLLIFDLPRSKFESLRLDVPLAAWSRKGTVSFRSSSFFESRFAER